MDIDIRQHIIALLHLAGEKRNGDGIAAVSAGCIGFRTRIRKWSNSRSSHSPLETRSPNETQSSMPPAAYKSAARTSVTSMSPFFVRSKSGRSSPKRLPNAIARSRTPLAPQSLFRPSRIPSAELPPLHAQERGQRKQQREKKAILDESAFHRDGIVLHSE